MIHAVKYGGAISVEQWRSQHRDVSLSVIVCAYSDDREDQLRSCIEALLEQLSPGDELIVVIDYNPRLRDAIARRYDGRLVVTANVHTRGLSGARNTGVGAASREVVAFVDDDAEVLPGWADRLRGHYRRADTVGVGGWAQAIWPDQRPGWFPEEFDWVVGCSHRGLPVDVSPVRNLIGCNMSFRRSVFDQVGGFSADVGRVGSRPVGCEETELCIRVTQASPQARLLFDPSIAVRHSLSHDRARFRYFISRCFSEGISKQKVSAMVGSSDALRSERRYVTAVLPVAVLRAVVDAVTGRGSRLDACARGLAVVVGLAVTTIGYAVELACSSLRSGQR